MSVYNQLFSGELPLLIDLVMSQPSQGYKLLGRQRPYFPTAALGHANPYAAPREERNTSGTHSQENGFRLWFGHRERRPALQTLRHFVLSIDRACAHPRVSHLGSPGLIFIFVIRYASPATRTERQPAAARYNVCNVQG